MVTLYLYTSQDYLVNFLPFTKDGLAKFVQLSYFIIIMSNAKQIHSKMTHITLIVKTFYPE